MPIKNLSNKVRMPRLGKIHLGIKKKNAQGVEYPTAVDYFVCPEEVQKVFGEKPTELNILIPVDDEEKWRSQYYRLYSRTRGLICKGDGVTCIRMVDTETGYLPTEKTKTIVMKEMNCAGRGDFGADNGCADYGVKCKEIMNVQFMLPEVPGLGIWQIDTGSINSILNINSAAELIARLYGRIALIPLVLTLEPAETKTPDGKKKTVYVLNLRTKGTLMALVKSANQPIEKLLAEVCGVEVAPDDIDLPDGEDQVPELIIPEGQEPASEIKPKIVEVKVVKPNETPEHKKNIEDLYGKRKSSAPPPNAGTSNAATVDAERPAGSSLTMPGQDASTTKPPVNAPDQKPSPAPANTMPPGTWQKDEKKVPVMPSSDEITKFRNDMRKLGLEVKATDELLGCTILEWCQTRGNTLEAARALVKQKLEPNNGHCENSLHHMRQR